MVEVVVTVDVVKGIIVVLPIPTVSEGKRETNNWNECVGDGISKLGDNFLVLCIMQRQQL